MKSGEQYIFCPLESVQGPRGEESNEVRIITVHSVSVGGKVSYVIEMEDMWGTGTDKSMHSSDYLTVKDLIADGIWKKLEEAHNAG